MRFWSRGAEEVFGYAAAEALDGDLFELVIPKNDLETAREKLREAAELLSREAALAAGCDAFLVKPIDTRTLAQQVTEIVEKKASAE